MVYNGYGLINTYCINNLVWVKTVNLQNGMIYWFIGNRMPTAHASITKAIDLTPPISNKILREMVSDNDIENVNFKELGNKNLIK